MDTSYYDTGSVHIEGREEIDVISKRKLKNFLLDLSFKAERLPDCPEEELMNKGAIEALDKIFEAIAAERFDL